MARTVIEIDDDKPAEAAEIFGTSTRVATVNAALEDAVKRRKRASFLTWPAEGGLPGLTGPVEETADGLGRPRRHRRLIPLHRVRSRTLAWCSWSTRSSDARDSRSVGSSSGR
ncbi:type II toxin-antitoxin system VapB family antitoxin [Streptomyces sp. TE5632]